MLQYSDFLKREFYPYRDNESNPCFQKKITDINGNTKYVIHITKSTFPHGISYEARVQFYCGKDTFNIILLYNPDNTVEDIERKINNLWIKGGFNRYE